MPLRLTITSYHKLTPGQRAEFELDRGELKIGRNPENDWVLPDPERLVSGQHCVIQLRDGTYYLTDTSTNGVQLMNAGVRMHRGNSEPLRDGELLRVGEYDILVQINGAPQIVSGAPGTSDPFTGFDALIKRQAPGEIPPRRRPQQSADPRGRFAPGHQARPVRFSRVPGCPPPALADHVPPERHDFRPPEPQRASAPRPAKPARHRRFRRIGTPSPSWVRARRRWRRPLRKPSRNHCQRYRKILPAAHPNRPCNGPRLRLRRRQSGATMNRCWKPFSGARGSSNCVSTEAKPARKWRPSAAATGIWSRG